MSKSPNENEFDGAIEVFSATNGDVTDKAADMVMWTKRIAFFLGFSAFIIMWLVSFDFENYMDTANLLIATIKGFGAGIIFWVGGLIIGNIFLKGLITDIPVKQSHLVDGGMLQRIYLYQQRLKHDDDGNVIHVELKADNTLQKTAKRPKDEQQQENPK